MQLLSADEKRYPIAHHAIIYMGFHFHVIPELKDGWEDFDEVPTEEDLAEPLH